MAPSGQLHRKRLRAPGYDYATPGMYWVTICVHHMECRFGTVVDGEMHLNDAGAMVDQHWRRLPERFAGLELDAFIVMPNHLHAIVFLTQNEQCRSASLSEAIGAFKSVTTVEYTRGVHARRFPPYDRSLWQRSFRDRIIQSDQRLEVLRGYVKGNPGRWQERQDQVRG